MAPTLRTAGLVAGGILAAVLLLAGILYAADYGMEATIVQKDCPQVTAETHVGSVPVTRRVSGVSCVVVQPGDVVVYHIRSGELVYKP